MDLDINIKFNFWCMMSPTGHRWFKWVDKDIADWGCEVCEPKGSAHQIYRTANNVWSTRPCPECAHTKHPGFRPDTPEEILDKYRPDTDKRRRRHKQRLEVGYSADNEPSVEALIEDQPLPQNKLLRKQAKKNRVRVPLPFCARCWMVKPGGGGVLSNLLARFGWLLSWITRLRIVSWMLSWIKR